MNFESTQLAIWYGQNSREKQNSILTIFAIFCTIYSSQNKYLENKIPLTKNNLNGSLLFDFDNTSYQGICEIVW